MLENILFMILGMLILVGAMVVRAAYLTYQKLTKTSTKKIDKKQLCKGPHAWMQVTAKTNDGIKDVQICRGCGLISGMDMMMPLDTVDKLEENKKLDKIEQKLLDEFLLKEESQLKKFIEEDLKREVSLDNILRIHNAGMTFNDRYSLYIASKSKEIEEELNRGNN